MRRAAIWAWAMVIALLATPGRTFGQAKGSIDGWVTDAATGRALAGVEVLVLDHRVRARTDNMGAYRLRGVPAGKVHVRLERTGYAVTVEEVEVLSGEAMIADFTLALASTVLDAIVVTGRRGRPPPGEGASVGSLGPGDLSRSATGRTSELISRRVPGVLVWGGGQAGAGVSVQIRGLNSFILSNEPLMFVDGVRVSNSAASPPRNRSRTQTILDLIDAASIDRIEVLRGPAAAMLYGDGATNGAILIYTKNGARADPD